MKLKNISIVYTWLLISTMCCQINGAYAQENASRTMSWKALAGQAHANSNVDAAIDYYEKWLEADPGDFNSWYNLACIYSLQEQKEKAINAFAMSVDMGFTNAAHASSDPDLKFIRNEGKFKVALEKCMKLSKAEADAKAKAETIENSVLHHSEMKSIGSYLVILPEDYDSSNAKYPLRVILHGSGSNEINHGKLANKFGRDGFIYLVPRAPYPNKAVVASGKPGWTAWHHDRIGSGDAYFKKQSSYYADWIAHCIDEVRRDYRIEGDKSLVIGHSQGAHFTNVLAMQYPEKVKAYLSYAGFIRDDMPFTANDFEQLKTNNIKVALLHGKQDGVVASEYSIRLNDLMTENGSG